jgi:hypothetical protein
MMQSSVYGSEEEETEEEKSIVRIFNLSYLKILRNI